MKRLRRNCSHSDSESSCDDLYDQKDVSFSIGKTPERETNQFERLIKRSNNKLSQNSNNNLDDNSEEDNYFNFGERVSSALKVIDDEEDNGAYDPLIDDDVIIPFSKSVDILNDLIDTDDENEISKDGSNVITSPVQENSLNRKNVADVDISSSKGRLFDFLEIIQADNLLVFGNMIHESIESYDSQVNNNENILSIIEMFSKLLDCHAFQCAQFVLLVCCDISNACIRRLDYKKYAKQIWKSDTFIENNITHQDYEFTNCAINWSTKSLVMINSFASLPVISSLFCESIRDLLENNNSKTIEKVKFLIDFFPISCLDTLKKTRKYEDILFQLLQLKDDTCLLSIIKRLDLSLIRMSNYRGTFHQQTNKFRRNILSDADSHEFSVYSHEIKELLIKVESIEGGLWIHWIIEDEMHDLALRLLIAIPELSHAKDSNGRTALHSACMMGNILIVAHLIDHEQVSPFAVDEEGWTALMYGIAMEKIDCVRLILQSNQSDSSISFQHMRILGKMLNIRHKDLRENNQSIVGEMLKSLAIIPEFRAILNDVIKQEVRDGNIDIFDKNSDLSFVLSFPSLLDLDNKLLLCYYICKRQDDYETIHQHDRHVYPILFQDGFQLPKCIFLERNDSFSSLVKYCTQQSYASHILRSNVMFQFRNEVGIGHGVQREVIEVLSSSLVNGSSKIFKYVQLKEDIVYIPRSDVTCINLAKSHRSCNVATNKSNESNNKSNESKFPHVISNTRDEKYKSHLQSLLIDDNDEEEEDDDDDNSLCDVSDSSDESFEDNYDSRLDCDVIKHKIPMWRELYDDSFLIRGIHKVTALKSSFYTFGKFVGHLLLRKMLSRSSPSSKSDLSLPIDISPTLWSLVLQREVHLEDLEDLDNEMFSNISWLSNQEGESISDLCLTFTSAIHIDDPHSMSQIIDLIPQGSEIDVDETNKSEYIELLIYHCIVGRMIQAADYIRHGIIEVIPSICLNIFQNGLEFSTLISSGDVDINVIDWQDCCTYDKYDESSLQIIWFWKFVFGLNKYEKELLLRFITGASRIPIGGFIHLNPPMRINRVQFNESRSLPTAATCFNQLKLPEYASEELLRKQMTIAIHYGNQGFSFS